MKSNQIEAKQNKDGKENRHYTTGIITLHNGKTKQNKTKENSPLGIDSDNFCINRDATQFK